MFALAAVGLVVPSVAAGVAPAASAARTKYNFNIGWQFHLNDPRWSRESRRREILRRSAVRGHLFADRLQTNR